MTYLRKWFNMKKTPQSAADPGLDPGAATRRGLRVGGRRLDAARPLPDPRQRGRHVLHRRARADARERRGGRCAASRPTACAPCDRIVDDLRRGPRAEERPGPVRARAGRRSSATSHAPRRATRRCRRSAASARTCSTSRSTCRRSAAGAAACAARSPRGTTTWRPSGLAYQAVKYQSRDGWSHRDLLRLAHPRRPRRRSTRPSTTGWSRAGTASARRRTRTGVLATIWAFERAKRATRRRRTIAARLIRDVRPAARVRPDGVAATTPAVWEALLERMPLTAHDAQPRHDDARSACSRRARATRSGLVDRRLERRRARCKRARVHPIAGAGRAEDLRAGPRRARASSTWKPVAQIIDALDAAFYATFGTSSRRGAAHAARARRLGLDGRRPGRRHAGPDAARGQRGDGAGHGGRRAAARSSPSRPDVPFGAPGRRQRHLAAGHLAAPAAGRRGRRR